jgi:hypothetical protein
MMIDAPERATDVGGTQRAGKHAGTGPRRVDIADQDQIFDLVNELRHAGDRRLMQVTLAEHRAIAGFATRALIIATHAVELIDMVERGDAAQRQAALDALQQVVRNP